MISKKVKWIVPVIVLIIGVIVDLSIVGIERNEEPITSLITDENIISYLESADDNYCYEIKNTLKERLMKEGYKPEKIVFTIDYETTSKDSYFNDRYILKTYYRLGQNWFVITESWRSKNIDSDLDTMLKFVLNKSESHSDS